MEHNQRNPNILWPSILILVGLIWLLGNLGVILPVSTLSLIQLWPLLLIVIGLDLVFGTRYRHASLWIGIGAIFFIAVFLWLGPGGGIVEAPTRTTSEFKVPLGNTRTAEINLRLSIPKTEVKPLTNSTDAFFAKVDHFWSMIFSSEGDKNKIISLRREEFLSDWFTWMAIGEDLKWEIGLTPQVPLRLKINGGAGESDIRLAGIWLNELFLNVGSGTMNLELPKSAERYQAKIKGGSAMLNISLPCSNAEIRLNGGSGDILVNLLNGCGLRIEVDNAGSGLIEFPPTFTQVMKGINENEGVWENALYASSPEKLLVIVENGSSGVLSFK